MKTKKRMFVVIGLIVSFLVFFGCDTPANPIQESETGSITGKAIFTGSDNHAGINITLEKTVGLNVISVINANQSITMGNRSINNSRSVTGVTKTLSDGTFVLENIPAGTYTLYASSQNSLEKAVTTNVIVTANESTNITEALKLVAATPTILHQNAKLS